MQGSSPLRILLLFSLLLIPTTFLVTSHKPHVGKIFYYAQYLVYPFSYVWHKSYTWTLDTWHSYLYLQNQTLENKRLHGEVATLRMRLSLLKEAERKTANLQELLNFHRQYALDMLIAQVVSSPVSLAFQSVRLDRGIAHGIKPGMPVIAPQGVVGQVLRVGDAYADVQLLTDNSFYSDVLIERTRLRTVLKGNMQSCLLQIRQATDLRIGDTITSSGILGDFPAGLPVGEVIKISYKEGNVTQKVTVKPWVDHKQLQQVAIIKRRSTYLQQIQDNL